MKPEQFGVPHPKFETGAKEVQTALMALAYKEAHTGETPDMSDAMERNKMAMEWIATYAAPYREYVETHPDFIDPTDEAALHQLLDRIKEETIH